jgi:hypothetical protein
MVLKLDLGLFCNVKSEKTEFLFFSLTFCEKFKFLPHPTCFLALTTLALFSVFLNWLSIH